VFVRLQAAAHASTAGCRGETGFCGEYPKAYFLRKTPRQILLQSPDEIEEPTEAGISSTNAPRWQRLRPSVRLGHYQGDLFTTLPGGFASEQGELLNFVGTPESSIHSSDAREIPQAIEQFQLNTVALRLPHPWN